MSDHNKNHGQGHPFFPGHMFQEALVMLGTILFVMFLALVMDLPHEPVADPTDTSYLPKPEWYFMFLFQFLKYFPGSMEVFAVVVVPTIGVGVLLFLPFLDKSPVRHPKQRPLGVSTAIITLFGIIVLTYLGMSDGGLEGSGESFSFFEKWKYGLVIAIIAINFIFTLLIVSKNSPIKDGASKFITASAVAVMSGLALVTVVVFSALQPGAAGVGGEGAAAAPGKALIASKCTSCHKFEGQGADFAVDLTKGSVKYKTADELTKFLKDPASVGSGMPKQQLSDEEIKDIADFLASLGGGGAAAPAGGEGSSTGGAAPAGDAGKGKSVFDTSCKGCHKFNGDGGTAGPDLTEVAKKMDNAALTAFIKDPAAAKPGTTMPKLPISDTDLQALTAFLAGGMVIPAGKAAKVTATASGDPNVVQLGLKTIEANACRSCHTINGEGGSFATDLSKIGAKRDVKWLKDYLTDPKSVMPDTQMPVVPLSAEEIAAVASYLATQK
ncbi:MAG: c-type cytochrome [Clostridia bacterium]|nr:c-type cytochrome [Clostridia bacterium]